MPGDIQTVMTDDPTGSIMVEFAKLQAGSFVNQNLTRTQIRNIFTEVRKIEALWDIRRSEAVQRLNLLRPKLAYAAKRTPPVEGLRDVLDEAIRLVDQSPTDAERDKRFKRFMNLFEAILAYHRALGGKN